MPKKITGFRRGLESIPHKHRAVYVVVIETENGVDEREVPIVSDSESVLSLLCMELDSRPKFNSSDPAVLKQCAPLLFTLLDPNDWPKTGEMFQELGHYRIFYYNRLGEKFKVTPVYDNNFPR